LTFPLIFKLLGTRGIVRNRTKYNLLFFVQLRVDLQNIPQLPVNRDGLTEKANAAHWKARTHSRQPEKTHNRLILNTI